MKRLSTIFLTISLAATASAQLPAFKILVFSATAGYRHASITNGIALIRALGATNNFAGFGYEPVTPNLHPSSCRRAGN